MSVGPHAATAASSRLSVLEDAILSVLSDQSVPAKVIARRLLEAFAPKGPVWFDEYHLGVGERRSLFRYLRDLGYGPLLLQAALAVFALLFAGATRLGVVRDDPRPVPRTTHKYLSALGSLYARTRDQSGALEVLGQRALEAPTVLVTNQHTLSDGENFTEGYRTMKLGRVVGEPTAGWDVYTSGGTMVDGTTVRLPFMTNAQLDGTPLPAAPFAPGLCPACLLQGALSSQPPSQPPTSETAGPRPFDTALAVTID